MKCLLHTHLSSQTTLPFPLTQPPPEQTSPNFWSAFLHLCCISSICPMGSRSTEAESGAPVYYHVIAISLGRFFLGSSSFVPFPPYPSRNPIHSHDFFLLFPVHNPWNITSEPRKQGALKCKVNTVIMDPGSVVTLVTACYQ